MDNYVGKRLDGRYEVQEIVGVGGMSVVYKAYDNVDDRIVAVKILKDEFLNNEEFKRRFKNESKAIAYLSHPNIVKVYDVNFGEKLQYIVMEYIDGITLKEYINKQGAITWNDALYFMTQILKAVQHAHDKGIVHRDIKPQNIILLPTGNIKVTDFGIARFSRSETRTLTEQAIGSVHYIAPEQAKGEYTDEKADIYSLGVVLYEMLAGSVPFEAENAVSVALMQLQANAKRLTDINADIPLGLEQICIHAMQKNPIDRYQTATEMLFDIEEIIKNPNTTFNYESVVDSNPTKVIGKNVQPNPVENEYEEEEYYDDNAENERKKKVVTAVVIGVIVLVAAIVLLVMAVTGSFNTTTNKLESFVGQSYDDIVDSKAYTYEFIQENEETNDYETGTVIRQSPEAGSKVLADSRVTLYVAVSANDMTVPNVYGLNEKQSAAKFEKEGITSYKIIQISSDTVEEGKVVYTDPKAGTVVDETTNVILYISSGPSTTVISTIRVPDVYGLSQSGARAFLEAYGFTNVSFVTQSSDAPKDTVVGQSPTPGSTAKENDTIKVIISSGVTTTTTEPSVKISVTVKLPTCIDENGEYLSDTITVTLDGKTYLNQTVSLNGSNKVISITGDSSIKQKIVVELKNSGELETVVTSGEKDEAFEIDFTGSSSDDRTTEPVSEEPTEEVTEE